MAFDQKQKQQKAYTPKSRFKHFDAKKAHGYVYRNLAMREWATKMLLQKLVGRYGQEHKSALQDILDEFTEQGLLSDQRFAHYYVRDCRDHRGYGPVKTKMMLMEKGVSTQIFEEYLAVSHDIWFVRAAQAQHKKYGGQPDTMDEYASHTRFLSQRGFTPAHIKAACYNNAYWRDNEVMLPEEEREERHISLADVKKALQE